MCQILQKWKCVELCLDLQAWLRHRLLGMNKLRLCPKDPIAIYVPAVEISSRVDQWLVDCPLVKPVIRRSYKDTRTSWKLVTSDVNHDIVIPEPGVGSLPHSVARTHV